MKFPPIALSLLLVAGASSSAAPASFGDDVRFLKQHQEVVVLTDRSGQSQVALVGAWQGRVMTSTAEGEGGQSFGWINRELIASGKPQPHIHVFGGEDRFWLGPEGGQFSIFFRQGAQFNLDHWFTPAAIDTLPYTLRSASRSQARYTARFSVTNYSGVAFDLGVDRAVRLLSTRTAWRHLGVPAKEDVRLVAYETDNRITNVGQRPWEKSTGLLSIWILGMFNPSPATTIVVPIKPGPEAELGAKVTSDYFGTVPADRLQVKEDVIFFSGDGKYRSKIGVSHRRSRGVLGSYDAEGRVLTLVQFSQPAGAVDYVNSLWKLQDQPYAGDAANSYNDGPPSPGAKPLGPFYELESSSPAIALAPGKSRAHVHRTLHLRGSAASLDAVARAVLGVSLPDIQAALPR